MGHKMRGAQEEGGRRGARREREVSVQGALGQKMRGAGGICAGGKGGSVQGVMGRGQEGSVQ